VLTTSRGSVVSQLDLLRSAPRHASPETMIDMCPQFAGAYEGMHGGYLAATMAQALAAHAGAGHRLLSLNIHFLRPIQASPALLQVEPTHKGKRCGAFSLRLTQTRIALTGRAVLGTRSTSTRLMRLDKPDVPSFEECLSQPIEPSHRLGIEIRPIGSADGSSVRLCWMRMRDSRPLDQASLIILADGTMPVVLDHLEGASAAPTVEMAVHFANDEAASESPWVLGVFRDRGALGSWAIEDCELFTPDGVLALVCRQMRHVSFAPVDRVTEDPSS